LRPRLYAFTRFAGFSFVLFGLGYAFARFAGFSFVLLCLGYAFARFAGFSFCAFVPFCG
jgi:hypothetical protein